MLQIVANVARDGWAEFNLGSLQARLSEFDKALASVGHREIVDAICALANLGQIAVEEFRGVHLDIGRREDENYRSAFFGPTGFRVKTTHEGRKVLSHVEVTVADNVGEPDAFDDLLPIYRRRTFDADLPFQSQETLQDGTSLAMVMIDLDHFKAVNDTHLHAIGDQVLIGVAKIIETRIRGKGKAYRYGGEEIAALLPNYTVDEGVVLAETIRKQIEQSVFSDKKIRVTASFGLACLPEHTRVAGELAKCADDALYKAKHLGRNLVRVYGEPETKPAERTPERRQPLPGGVSDEEGERIRVEHFNGRAAICPKDGACLRVREIHSFGRRTPDIMVTCPLCGLQTMIAGPKTDKNHWI